MDECIHGLGPVSACVLCNGKARQEAERRNESPRFFRARHQDCWED